MTTTLQVYRDMAGITTGPDNDVWRQRSETARESMWRLRQLGVPLLAGSDAGWCATAFTTYWRELDELVRCGLSPVEAIHASTGAIASALNLDQRLGTVQPGLAADLLLVEGDVAVDIQCLQRVRAVFQSGNLVHGTVPIASARAA